MSDGSRFTTPHRNGSGSGSAPRVALVLPGGGARGAYEVGASSVLLPLLEERGDVGTLRLADVAANIFDGLWVDQIVDDLHRLATINSFVVDGPGPGPRGAADAYRAARGRKPYRKISYALVAPVVARARGPGRVARPPSSAVTLAYR